MTAWATKDSPLLSWFNRWIFKPVFVAHISADMERMEDYIEKTDLNYTIVRPPGLTNGMYIFCLILHEVCAVQAESVH